MKGISIDLRRGLIGALALLGALCASLAMSSGASAAEADLTLKGSFACNAANPCGEAETWKPGRLSVNEQTGDVYVIDHENDAIQVFDKDGIYKSSIPGSSVSGGSFDFGEDNDIAIDNSGGPHQGRIYLNTNYANYFALDSSTASEPHKSLWRVSYLAGEHEACGVAVDSNGNFFGSAYGQGVQQRSVSDGSLEGSPIVAVGDAGDTCNIAFNADNDLYVRHYDIPQVRLLSAPDYQFPGVIVGPAVGDVSVNSTDGYTYLAAGNGNVISIYDGDGPPLTFGSSGGVTLSAAPHSKTGRVYISTTADKVDIADPPSTLAVTKSGTGTGKVECKFEGGPAEPCSDTYTPDADVTVVATPDPGNTFDGFSGDCTGTTCELTMSAAKAVTANFTAITYDLAITKAGSGASASLVTCKVGVGAAGPCSSGYPEGTTVTVAAVPGANVIFDGFSGDCTGTTCELTMSADKAVTAGFTLYRKLNLSKTGNGAAASSLTCAVSPDPAGPCEATYPSGTVVTVAADPGERVKFDGFTGSGCTTSPCTVTMSGDKTLIAKFTIITHSLTVNKAGTGSGSVNCNGGTCASSYEEGANVTLAATADSGSTFTGWSGGGCSGAGSCTVTINAVTTVTATFTKDEVKADPPVSPPETPRPPMVDPPRPPQPEGIKCKKGFKKKTVKGKQKCVKVKKKKKKKRKKR